MVQPAYGAAASVAPIVHANLAQHLELARARGEQHLASLPAADTLAAMIDVAFWTSLRREEGYLPRISLAAVRADETPHPLHFDHPLPMDASALARVAPAVERPGVHLSVADSPNGLLVWGISRTIPKYTCVVEVAEAGLIVVKHHRGDEATKYANLAVLQGDRIRVVDEGVSAEPDCPAIVSSLLGFDSPGAWVGSMGVLVQLAVSMRAHGRGGLLLVVPAGTADWRESIVQPMLYAVNPPFGELTSRSLPERAIETSLALGEALPTLSREELSRTVDAIAGLTAVDGATVLTSDYQLLAFGAKVVRRRGSTTVEQITVTEPVRGGHADVVSPAQLGGTRHLAGAQFVHDQRDSVALVASQDGRFTIFTWGACEQMVHAHRIETLLL